MKKKFGSILIAIMMVMTMVPSVAFAGEQEQNEIPITEAYFSDKVFRDYIGETIDANKDGIVNASEILNTEAMNIFSLQLTSLEGIQYFTNLKYLYCYDNQLTGFPSLPDTLIQFMCGQNNITELPELPDSLELLDCGFNKITELPELPERLTWLYCGDNQIEALPELPESLEYLNCVTNKLKVLPELKHTKITELRCFDNQLTELPVLPDGVELIECAYNKITELPEIPDSVKVLNCSDIGIKTLPELPDGIKSLSAEYNMMEGVLDISNLDNLTSVYLCGNILTGLKVSDKADYEYVDVSYNFMPGKDAVTGRTDINWENVFNFGVQKTYCTVYGHNYSIIEAEMKSAVEQNYSADGTAYRVCSICGADERGNEAYEVIPCVNRIALSVAAYTYNGKQKNPTVKVYDINGDKIDASNYTVKYASGRKNVGSYKVTVNFKGDYYEGSRYVKFKINPKGTTLSTLSKAKKSFTAKWKKQTGKMATTRITGYQIRYSTSSKMTNAKIKTIKGYSKTSAKVSKLKAKKKYYVQVRTYKTVSGIKYYSAWSKSKAITTK